MRYLIFVEMTVLLMLTSCEKYRRDTVVVINGDMEFNVSDIRFYDTSTHVLYLSRSHEKLKDIESGTFAFLDEGDPVFSGSFWPGYLSSSPTGPIISTCPFTLQNFALKIDTWDNEERSYSESV